MKTIYFVSGNKEKFEEIEKFGKADGITIARFKKEIAELQTEDADKLVKAKAKEAFEELRRPVLIEQTALEIEAFEGMPALQTSYFYKRIGCEEIINYCGFKESFKACAKSIFCLCDGKQYYIGKGEEEGEIIRSADKIKDMKGFDWDVIFIPSKDNPEKKTYAESDKSKRSMRVNAWKNLKEENKINWETLLNDDEIKEEEERYLKELAELIKQKKVMLFIGAGISASLNKDGNNDKNNDKNNVKFPSWKELIEKLGENQGYDKELFLMYGDNMMLAEYAAIMDKNFVEQTIEEKLAITDAVKEELYKSEIYGKIYEIIKEWKCPIIYTTNYDELIEEYFKEKKDINYSKISNIKELNQAESDSIRVMKFHGDIKEKNNIVLAESTYFKRMDFKSWMDIQFQADVMNYHILFLGYGMSDINIKLLLYLARGRWTDKEKGPSAYIYTATPNEIQKKVFEENRIFTISGDEANKKKGTLKFLEKLSELVGKKESGQEGLSK